MIIFRVLLLHLHQILYQDWFIACILMKMVP